jgi:hypothetical protein
MTIVPRPVWPRRRAPWLSNRFGRGLLSPGALRLQLRRTWASYSVVERWWQRSPLVMWAERPSSFTLAVSLAMKETSAPGRPAGGTTARMVRPQPGPRPALARHRTTSRPRPGAARAADITRVRREHATTRFAERAVRNGRGQRWGSDVERTLLAAAPTRVLARSPHGDATSPGGFETGGARPHPLTERSPSPERAVGPPDIERLTDSVVAAIDRRLWSHRERMEGR